MWPEGEKERVVEFTSDAIKALEKVLQQIEGGAEPDTDVAARIDDLMRQLA